MKYYCFFNDYALVNFCIPIESRWPGQYLLRWRRAKVTGDIYLYR